MHSFSAQVRALRARTTARRGQYALIAAASGLSRSWVSHFARGALRNPRIETLRALERALDRIERPAKPVLRRTKR